jgi:protease secretion system outer membrane protein
MTHSRRPRTVLATALVCALAAFSPAAYALGLADSWRAAQRADPLYIAAKYELDATRFAVPIARSQLLPQVAINTGDTKVNGTQDSTDTNSQVASRPLDYFARSRALTLRMPIFNKDAWARLSLSEAQVATAEALYLVRTKDLAIRLGRAYFPLLFALEGVELAKSAVQAYSEAVAFATRNFRGGEGTRTEVSEAEARLQIARAELIDAQDQVEVARRALQTIVGMDTSTVTAPATPSLLPPLDPPRLESWLERVDAQSPDVLTRRLQAEQARLEVTRAQAGHYPRLDAVAAASIAENDTVNNLNTRIRQNTIGIQLNIPLYSGGFVQASTEQALLTVRKAEQELEAELNTQRVDARRQFLAVVNGRARIEAFDKAVSASQVALEGTRFGVRAGLRTNLDVLNAERQVFLARRDLSQARYAYMLAVLQLRAVAGDSLDEAIEAIDRALRIPAPQPVQRASSGS